MMVAIVTDTRTSLGQEHQQQSSSNEPPIPSPVSFKTLTNIYDEHVARLNSSTSEMNIALSFTDTVASNDNAALHPNDEYYHILRLTCSILLAIIISSSNLPDEKNNRATAAESSSSFANTVSTLKQTAWRCYLLERYFKWIQSSDDYYGVDKDPLADDFLVDDVSESIIRVEVQVAKRSVDSIIDRSSSDQSWSWKLVTENEQNPESSKQHDEEENNNNNNNNDNNRIISVNQQELEEEEAILIRMASTPIPPIDKNNLVQTTSTNNNHRHQIISHDERISCMIQEKLRKMWSMAFS